MASSGKNAQQLVDEAVTTARSKIDALLGTDPSLRTAFLRLAFADAIAYNPLAKVHGPKGSIRFAREASDAPIELKNAIEKLEKLKTEDASVKSYVSYADLCQLAGIEAIKSISGMVIKFQHGRTDSFSPASLDEFTKIQQGDNASIVRSIFYRHGFNDREIVALSSAIIYWMNPTLFSSNTSGQIDLCAIYIKLNDEMKKQVSAVTPPPDPSEAPKKQPISGTSETAKVDRTTTITQSESSKRNSSTNRPDTSISTPSMTTSFQNWKCLLSDASFRKHVELFAQDHKQFSVDYVNAHQKLSELGFQHFPKPISVEAIDYHDMKHGIAFAVAMTLLFGFVGFFYEAMRT